MSYDRKIILLTQESYEMNIDHDKKNKIRTEIQKYKKYYLLFQIVFNFLFPCRDSSGHFSLFLRLSNACQECIL